LTSPHRPLALAAALSGGKEKERAGPPEPPDCEVDYRKRKRSRRRSVFAKASNVWADLLAPPRRVARAASGRPSDRLEVIRLQFDRGGLADEVQAQQDG
jgi:hypothetical protein